VNGNPNCLRPKISAGNSQYRFKESKFYKKFRSKNENQMTTKLTAAVFLIFTAIVGAAQTAVAQTPPTVRIVLPERFRVITNQYFDLRVEAEGINRATARVWLIVEGENGKESLNYVGQAEITTITTTIR
jgi:hypothetical protein